MTLLSLVELAARLLTTRAALYCRAHRDPYALPPSVKIPGDNRLMFDAEVVEQWLKNPAAFRPTLKHKPTKSDVVVPASPKKGDAE